MAAEGPHAARADQTMPTTDSGAKAKLRYRFDTMLSRGTAPVVAWLGALTLVICLVGGVVLALARIKVGDGEVGLLEGFWQSLIRASDAGAMGGDSGWGLRAVSLLVTIAGLFVVSALIGLISAGIDARLEQLRKGRSPVIEDGHTLVLGWSSKLFAVLSELAVANANQKRPCVVVMAPHDKVEMEDEIRSRAGDMGNTRVVCRTGDPSDPADLAIVRPERAKSVIVLAPEDEDGDAHVVRSVLSLLARDQGLANTQVVAEVPTRQTAMALEDALHSRITTVVSNEVIGLITAQVCRQAGLGAVYQDLLDFDGDEIYFQHEPRLAGHTFAEAVLAYETSSVIGVRRADGKIELNPSMTSKLAAGDAVIAISEDDDTIVLSESRLGSAADVGGAGIAPELPVERILILGWNEIAPMIVDELSRSLGPGSHVTIAVDPSLVEPTDVVRGTGGSTLDVVVATNDDGTLASIRQAVDDCRPDHVVVLCYRHRYTVSQADARALLTLLQLRQLFNERQHLRGQVTVVSELLDAHDVPLAEATGVDDFIVSDKLNSLMLAQLAENPELSDVFGEMFDAHGTVISLRPVASYHLGSNPSFHDIVRAGCDRGELVIGYRRKVGDDVETKVNPPKTLTLPLAADDHLVVLSTVAPPAPRPAAASDTAVPAEHSPSAP